MNNRIIKYEKARKKFYQENEREPSDQELADLMSLTIEQLNKVKENALIMKTASLDKVISEDANQRLKAIKEFTEFGSGFKIATRDLQIRGAGSLFGEVQSGHMEQVGYDMYNRLLNEVVKEIQGEEIQEEQEITIDINLSSFIPEKYIEDSSQKIEIYQDIANCKNDEDIQDVTDEIIDRFGNMPTEVENLIEIARIKVLAKKANVYKIQEKQMGILFMFDKFDNSKIDDLLSKYRNDISFSASGKPYITLNVDKYNKVDRIKEFLNTVI